MNEEIKAAFERSNRRYGSPRVWLALSKTGTGKMVSVATIARRMYLRLGSKTHAQICTHD
ncbi:MAG: transposase [Saprospiraceae bacterium]